MVYRIAYLKEQSWVGWHWLQEFERRKMFELWVVKLETGGKVLFQQCSIGGSTWTLLPNGFGIDLISVVRIIAVTMCRGFVFRQLRCLHWISICCGLSCAGPIDKASDILKVSICKSAFSTWARWESIAFVANLAERLCADFYFIHDLSINFSDSISRSHFSVINWIYITIRYSIFDRENLDAYNEQVPLSRWRDTNEWSARHLHLFS